MQISGNRREEISLKQVSRNGFVEKFYVRSPQKRTSVFQRALNSGFFSAGKDSGADSDPNGNHLGAAHHFINKCGLKVEVSEGGAQWNLLIRSESSSDWIRFFRIL